MGRVSHGQSVWIEERSAMQPGHHLGEQTGSGPSPTGPGDDEEDSVRSCANMKQG